MLNSALFTNDSLCKIGYVSDPNCTFCHQLTQTIPDKLYSFFCKLIVEKKRIVIIVIVEIIVKKEVKKKKHADFDTPALRSLHSYKSW